MLDIDLIGLLNFIIIFLRLLVVILVIFGVVVFLVIVNLVLVVVVLNLVKFLILEIVKVCFLIGRLVVMKVMLGYVYLI